MSITVSGFPLTVSTALVRGGPAGNFKVPGIRAGDTLLAVNSVTGAIPPVPTNRIGNASIPASSTDTVAIATIDTTGLWLLVSWAKAE